MKGNQMNPQPPADYGFITVTQAAETLKISRAHAYKMCREGVIPCLRLGRTFRISAQQFDQWLNGGTK
jgi:excisionase family DNA binding protein